MASGIPFSRLAALACGLCILAAPAFGQAAIWTDFPDYAPGTTVLISGSGFEPGATVTLQVVHLVGGTPGGNGHAPWDTTADAFGSVADSWYVDPDDSYLSVFLLTAFDAYGNTAQATFTDAIQADFRQSANNDPGPSCLPPGPPVGNVHWTSGLLSHTNAIYHEGMVVPQRLILTDITPTPGDVHTLVFWHDAFRDGRHAYDFLASWPQAIATADAIGPGQDLQYNLVPNECGCSIGPPNGGVTGIDTICVDLHATGFPVLIDAPDAMGLVAGDDVAARVAAFEAAFGNRQIRVIGDAPFVGTPVLTFTGYTGGPNLRANYTLSWVSSSSHVAIEMGARLAVTGTPSNALAYAAGARVESPFGPNLQFGLSHIDLTSLANRINEIRSSQIDPVPSIEGDFEVPCGSTEIYTSTASNGVSCTTTWSLHGNTSGAVIIGPDTTVDQTSSSVSVAVGVCGQFILRVEIAYIETTSVHEQLVIVTDDVPPEITCPGPVTVSCDADVPEADVNAVDATDNCGTPVVTWEGDVSEGTCPRVITRTYKAVDACGNEASCTQTITVDDQTGPDMTCPGGVLVTCDGDVPDPDVDAVIATDNCGGAVVVTHDGDSAVGACPKIITRTYKGVDACGNESYCTQTITVQDLIPPDLTCPGAVTVSCDGEVPLADVGAVIATDNCGGNVTVTHVGDVPLGTCPKVITRTYRGVDACGNESFCTQTITVQDLIPPDLTCPGAVTVSCDGDVPAADVGAVIATDNCGGTVTVTHEGDVPSGTCPKVITRTYKGVDACGNEAFCTQTITVDDQAAPTLTCPGAVTVSCDGDVPAADVGAVIASDNCGGTVTVTHEGDAPVGTCPKVITRTYKGVDACGNEAFCTQTITVDDQTGPDLTCPGAVTVSCDVDVPEADVNAVVATDGCGGTVTVTHEGDVPVGTCPKVITRTYKGVDACGNESFCTQTITVDDQTGPDLTCPAAVNVGCDGDVPPADVNAVVATDGCGGTVTVTHEGDVPVGTCPKVITRTYKGVDACGNESFCTQTITVHDVTPPEITCPPPMSVPCGTSVEPEITGWATATDECNPEPIVWYTDDVSGACPDPSVITRTWYASDGCNVVSCVQVITRIPPPGQGCTPSSVTNIGGGCGNPPPYLTTSPPTLGSYFTFRLFNAPPNGIVVMMAQLGPPFGAPLPLGGTCTLYPDLAQAVVMSDFYLDESGDFVVRFALGLVPEFIGLELLVQAGVVAPNGPIGGFAHLSNALHVYFGSCPPFCTSSREGFAGNDYVGQVFDLNYLSEFPSGLDIGVYDIAGGAAAPNGLRFDGTPTGRAALKAFLTLADGPSGAFLTDAVNPGLTLGGGSLAIQTATLALNIAFNDAGLMGSGVPGFANQIYLNYPGIPDSLNGQSITQILAAANQALAGNGLPVGYTFDALLALVTNINLAYDGCVESFWASKYLFSPVN